MRKFGMRKKLIWFAIYVALFAWFGKDGQAQNPQVSATKLRGRTISTTAPTNGQVYQWDTVTLTWKPTTPSSGTAPCGPTVGEVQLYATATTLGCDTRYLVDTSGNGEMRAGTSLRFLGYGAMVSATDDISLYVGATDDSEYRLVDINIFVPPGGSTEKAATGVIIRAQADSGTKYFDTQVSFGVAEAVNGTGASPYAFGAEGHCTTAINCAVLADYNLFLANSITGETLLENTSASPHQLDVPATTQFATLGTYVAAGPIVSNDTADSNPFSLSKNAIADAAPGAGYASLKAVAGTNAGTCKIVIKAGTSTTPVTLIDNVGTGC